MKKAVALGYQNNDEAPKVLAKGFGIQGEKIVKEAEKYGIFIKEDPDLVEILAKINLNQFVTENLYDILAKLFAFIYTQNEKYGAQKS